MTQNICTKKEKVGSNQSFSEVPGAPWKKQMTMKVNDGLTNFFILNGFQRKINRQCVANVCRIFTDLFAHCGLIIV